MIVIVLMYLILLQGKIYTKENQDNKLLGLFVFFKIIVCKDDVSLLLRLQMLQIFVPGCTGRLRQMGLIVVTIKHWIIVLQQPILVGWD